MNTFIYYIVILSLGITNVKCIRINIDSEGIPRVFYKYDNPSAGWYPKPVELESEADMQRLFKHDDPSFGEALKCKEYPGVDMGTRQTWFYDVTYANGEMVTFPMKCISLPVKLPSTLINLNNLSHQEFRGKLVDDRAKESILNLIIKLLTNRHLTSDIPRWREFFSKLPVNDNFVFNNTLKNLVDKHKRPIQVSYYLIICMRHLLILFLAYRNLFHYQQSITPLPMI